MYRKEIISADPQRTLWWHLSHFKNHERVASLIQKSHQTADPKNAKKQAKQIRYCIEQAEEYFQSAEIATAATKPLLLYYGMASLAWALILFKKSGDYALDNIKIEHQSHGLERPRLDYGIRCLPLQEVLSKIRTSLPKPISLKNEDIELRGTFGLLYAVSRLEPMAMTCQRKNGDVIETWTELSVTTPTSTTAQSLSAQQLQLQQLILDIPDMNPSLAELGIMPLFARISDLKVFVLGEGRTRTVILTSSTPEMNTALRARLKSYERVTVSELSGGLRLETHVEVEGDVVRIPSMSETLDGRPFIYIRHDVEPLPETCAFLAVMFIFGTLVRYHPHIWMHWLDQRHPIVEVVETFLPVARRKYPNLILNNLTGDSFIFKS